MCGARCSRNVCVAEWMCGSVGVVNNTRRPRMQHTNTATHTHTVAENKKVSVLLLTCAYTRSIPYRFDWVAKVLLLLLLLHRHSSFSFLFHRRRRHSDGKMFAIVNFWSALPTFFAFASLREHFQYSLAGYAFHILLRRHDPTMLPSINRCIATHRRRTFCSTFTPVRHIDNALRCRRRIWMCRWCGYAIIR